MPIEEQEQTLSCSSSRSRSTANCRASRQSSASILPNHCGPSTCRTEEMACTSLESSRESSQESSSVGAITQPCAPDPPPDVCPSIACTPRTLCSNSARISDEWQAFQWPSCPAGAPSRGGGSGLLPMASRRALRVATSNSSSLCAGRRSIRKRVTCSRLSPASSRVAAGTRSDAVTDCANRVAMSAQKTAARRAPNSLHRPETRSMFFSTPARASSNSPSAGSDGA